MVSESQRESVGGGVVAQNRPLHGKLRRLGDKRVSLCNKVPNQHRALLQRGERDRERREGGREGEGGRER